MDSRDEILRAAVKSCPGATTERTLLGDLAKLVFDGPLIINIAKAFADKDPHEYLYPNIPHAIENHLKKAVPLEDETIYYVICRNVSDWAPVSTKMAYFYLTTHGIIEFLEGEEENYRHFDWLDIESFGHNDTDSTLTCDGDTYELLLHSTIGEKKANPEFQDWLICSIVNEAIKLHDELNRLKEEQKLEDEIFKELVDSIDEWENFNQTEQMESLQKCEERLLAVNLSKQSQCQAYKLMAFLAFMVAWNTDEGEGDGIAVRRDFWRKTREFADKFIKLSEREDDEVNAFRAFAMMSLCHNVHGYHCMKYLFRTYSDDYKFFSENDLEWCRSNALEILVDDFLSYDYNDRRFLVIDSKMNCESEKFVVLPKGGIPKGIQFPLGHPQEGTMYICHPYNQNLYLPSEMYDFELFKDKIGELNFVLQTMGATKIKLRQSNASETQKKSSDDLSVKGGVSAKVNSAHLNANLKSESEEYERLRQEYAVGIESIPQRMPYIPDNLVWYPHEAEWQRIFQGRQVGTTHYVVNCSLEQELKIDNRLQMALEADFRALLAKIEGNVQYEGKNLFGSNQSVVWQLDVTFESLDVLRERNMAPMASAALPDVSPKPGCPEKAELSEEEQEYMECVREAVEDDGAIDERERRFLERFRKTTSLSEERARELEAMVCRADDGERKYREFVRELLADGITAKERKQLERFRKQLNISEDCAARIEKEETK